MTTDEKKSHILQKATLRDEFGYAVLPRTVSSAITMDDREYDEPRTLSDEISSLITYVNDSMRKVDEIETTVEKHTHPYITEDKAAEMILKAQLPETELDISILLDKKVDKVEGKGLSANDFTNEHKEKLENLTAEHIAETDDRLFFTRTERLKLARLQNDRFNISYNDLVDVPKDLVTQEILNKTVSDIIFGDSSVAETFATKVDLTNLGIEIDSRLATKSNEDHEHSQYLDQARVIELINTQRPNIDLTSYVTANTLNEAMELKADASHQHSEYTTMDAVRGYVSDILSGTEVPNIDLSAYATKNDLLTKVDKESGKGLSSNDYTLEEKQKLASLSNYTHPETHSVNMITGLANVSKTGSYNDLLNKPKILTEDEIKILIANAQLGGDGENPELAIDLTNLQTKSSNDLNTVNKTIVGAINELESSLDIALQYGDSIDAAVVRITELETKVASLESTNKTLSNKVTNLEEIVDTLLHRVTILEAVNSATEEAKLIAVENRYNNLVVKFNNIALEQGTSLNINNLVTEGLTIEQRISNLNANLETLEETDFVLVQSNEFGGMVEYTMNDNMTNAEKIAVLENKLFQLESLNIVLIQN